MADDKPDVIAESAAHGSKSIAELEKAYGAQPNESIQAAILRKNAETAKSQSEYIETALNTSGREIDRLNADYGVQPGESLPAAIIRNNEAKLHSKEQEFCGRVDEAVQKGASPQNAYQNLLDQYGFNANTRFSCAPVTNGEQPQNGVNTNGKVPEVYTGIDGR